MHVQHVEKDASQRALYKVRLRKIPPSGDFLGILFSRCVF